MTWLTSTTCGPSFAKGRACGVLWLLGLWGRVGLGFFFPAVLILRLIFEISLRSRAFVSAVLEQNFQVLGLEEKNQLRRCCQWNDMSWQGRDSSETSALSRCDSLGAGLRRLGPGEDGRWSMCCTRDCMCVCECVCEAGCLTRARPAINQRCYRSWWHDLEHAPLPSFQWWSFIYV